MYTSSAEAVALEAVDVLLDVVADLLEVGKARELDHRRRAADEDHLPCEGGGVSAALRVGRRRCISAYLGARCLRRAAAAAPCTCPR